MTDFDGPLEEGRELSRQFADLRLDAAQLSTVFSSEMGRVRDELRSTRSEAESLASTFAGSLRTAFNRLVFDGAKASDVLRGLARDISSSVLNSALRPVQSAVGQGVSSLFSGFFGGFANGGAFSAGQVRAFAGGGVVDGPTMFPMRGGVGLMGEAGPEAIMPLSRGPDGRLGVRAGGGGGSVVNVNIQTPDVPGFQRSRSQVAAQIAKAVRRGPRNF